MDKDKEIIIEIYSGTLWEAAMIKNLLQEAGIKSFVNNSVRNDYAYHPIMANGVKIMIFESDAERARQIVNRYYDNMMVDP